MNKKVRCQFLHHGSLGFQVALRKFLYSCDYLFKAFTLQQGYKDGKESEVNSSPSTRKVPAEFCNLH